MFYSIEEQIVRQAMKLPKLNPQQAHEMELLLDQAYRALQNKQPKLARRILQVGGALEEAEDEAKKTTVKADETQLSEKQIEAFKRILTLHHDSVKNASLIALKKLEQSKEYRDLLKPIFILKAKKLQKWLASYGENYNLADLLNLKELDLDRKGFTHIPPEIGLLTNLKKLALTHDRIYAANGTLITRGITEIPPEIGLLTNLQELNLAGNQIMEIPPEIGLLTKLQNLDLTWNQIKKIPPEIGHLINLKSLSLSGNKITKIPPEIGKLTKLQGLYIRYNFTYDENNSLITSGITEIPPEIELLTNLQKLYLDENQITVIPPEIGQLINLEELNLSRNKFTKIPPEIGQLINLRELNLSQNQITELPPEIGLLTDLKELDLSFTGIKKTPRLRRGINILMF